MSQPFLESAAAFKRRISIYLPHYCTINPNMVSQHGPKLRYLMRCELQPNLFSSHFACIFLIDLLLKGSPEPTSRQTYLSHI